MKGKIIKFESIYNPEKVRHTQKYAHYYSVGVGLMVFILYLLVLYP